MSEKMIELQRQKLLASGGKAPNGTSHSNGATLPPAQRPRQNPRQAASTNMYQEDVRHVKFLQQLQQQRDDSRPGDAAYGPTVPTTLSRRILHQNGVGFLDSNVAALVSAMGDQFLATVLQQAVACRDQRVKGAELARLASRERKRHKRLFLNDVAARQQQHQDNLDGREQLNLKAIQAEIDFNRKTATPSPLPDDGKDGETPKSKKKKAAPTALPQSGKRKTREDFPIDGELEYDSLDEEQEYYAGHIDDDDSLGDEEDDDIMILQDVARPLAAWDFSFGGKFGMEDGAEIAARRRENQGVLDILDEMDEDEDDPGPSNGIEEDKKLPAAPSSQKPQSSDAKRKDGSRPSTPGKT